MKSFLRCILLYMSLLSLTSGSYSAPLKTFGEKISDSVITTKLTAQFTKNKLLNPLSVSIKTYHGRVTLSGNVNTKQAFIEAIKLAKKTKGVRSVNAEKLEIKSRKTNFKDAYITAKVETAILKAKIFDDESIPLVGINAKTNNGRVTLSGEVKSQKSIQALIKRVKAVKDVKQVISKLTIMKNTKKGT